MENYGLLLELKDWNKYVNSDLVPKINKKKKRKRYKIPTYTKFYSLYQYDRLLFRQLLNEWLKSPEGQNRTAKTLEEKQKEILDICYKRDSDGRLIKDSDEKHIFRCAVLQKIHEKIYDILIQQGKINIFDDRIIDGLYIHREEKQAEVNNTWNMSLKDRLIIHIRLLRALKKGLYDN